MASSGFALLNALIAATVLAIGLLGNAAMLVHSLQTSRLALQRTRAVALAADLAERLRADRAGAVAFALAPDTALVAPVFSCTTGIRCSSQQVAALELYSWQQSVLRALPDAQTAVAVAPIADSATNLYTITIRWMQSGDSVPASITLTVQT